MIPGSICLLPLPESGASDATAPLVGADVLAALSCAAVLMPPARSLRAFAREQLPAVQAEHVIVLRRDQRLSESAVAAGLAALNENPASLAGPVYRTAALRAALRAPFVDSDGIHDEIPGCWFELNVAAVHGVIPSFGREWTDPTPRETLRLLALAHLFLCRCPLLPELATLRQAAALHALHAWRRHHRVLPGAAQRAAATVLSQVPDLPVVMRGKLWLQLQLLPSSAGGDYQPLLREIEECAPGFFGGPALGDTTLQPPG